MFSHYCTPAEERRMDAWRRDVADMAAPIVVRPNDKAFRNGAPAPAQAYTDKRLDFRGSRAPPLAYEREPTKSSRRSRRDTQRSLSDYGRAPRRSSLRPTSRAGPDSYTRHPEYDSYRRGSSSKRASIWSSLFPTSRNSRPRAMTYDRPARRTMSPDYVYTRNEPEITVYQSRPKSQYASAKTMPKEYVVDRSGTTRSSRSRRDSFGVDEKMRLLDIRDRFRDEVERARQWQAARPVRRRDYDRRSSYY